MSVFPTKEQVTLCESIRESVDRFENERVVDLDRRCVWNDAAWKASASLGLAGLTAPVAYGGLGADGMTAVLALETLGEVCQDNALVFCLNAHLWTGVMPIVHFGTDDQKSRFLSGLAKGEMIGGNAMSERTSGSDVYAMKTTATRDGDDYVLNGEKIYITSAPIADVLIVFALTAPERGAFGISAFLVEKGTPGMSCTEPPEKLGMRTAQMGFLTFDNCRVPSGNLLGSEGGGLAIFTRSMEWERGYIMAGAVGAMRRQLDRCVAFARESEQFGQPISQFQLISQKLVDMEMRIETSRLLLQHFAARQDEGKSALKEAAMTKLHISEAWVRSSEDAIQIHGAKGYLTDEGILWLRT